MRRSRHFYRATEWIEEYWTSSLLWIVVIYLVLALGFSGLWIFGSSAPDAVGHKWALLGIFIPLAFTFSFSNYREAKKHADKIQTEQNIYLFLGQLSKSLTIKYSQTILFSKNAFDKDRFRDGHYFKLTDCPIFMEGLFKVISTDRFLENENEEFRSLIGVILTQGELLKKRVLDVSETYEELSRAFSRPGLEVIKSAVQKEGMFKTGPLSPQPIEFSLLEKLATCIGSLKKEIQKSINIILKALEKADEIGSFGRKKLTRSVRTVEDYMEHISKFDSVAIILMHHSELASFATDKIEECRVQKIKDFIDHKLPQMNEGQVTKIMEKAS